MPNLELHDDVPLNQVLRRENFNARFVRFFCVLMVSSLFELMDSSDLRGKANVWIFGN